MLHSKIVIVGAGAAGIAAASRLVSNNLTKFIILEAEDKIGGRISTSKLDGGQVELGAQWVHGYVNNVVYSLGSSAGLLSEDSVDLYKSQTILSDGSIMNDSTELKLFTLCTEAMNDKSALSSFSGSIKDYINKSVRRRMKRDNITVDDNILRMCLEWFERFQNSYDGSDSWSQTSARGTLQYHDCEGYSLIRWKEGGYANIFDILMGDNISTIKEKIVFNKRVKRITWDQTPVHVSCTDGKTYTADQVLVTVSLGVLKENFASLFAPSLPQRKIQAIKALGFGTVAKIFIKFPYRWWPPDCNGYNLLWKEPKPKGSSSWQHEIFGFYSVDCQPTVLCGWLVGEAARKMEQLSESQVMEACHQLLCTFLGASYNIPVPHTVLRSRWYSNPHTRGVYSFRTVASDECGVYAEDLASPLLHPSGYPVVLFGGEATHDHFYSSVHGAIETGWREADRILKPIRQKLCKRNMFQGRFSVIIVGAGMAGLGAAMKLIEARIYDVLILEGQEQAGGRVQSVCLDETGQQYIELGAQWVHGENNPIHKISVQKNLLSKITSEEGQGIYVKTSGKEISLSVVQEVAGVVGRVLEECCQFVNHPEYPPSVGHYLHQQFSKYLDSCHDVPSLRKDKMDLFDWHIRFLVIDNSCDHLNKLSAKDWGLYQFTGGADYNNFLHGYFSLVQTLTRDLPSNCLRTCTPVTTLSFDDADAPVQVACEDGSQYWADHVIVTSSLGYLKEHHQTMFSPPLPSEMIKAIDSMGFDTINKLFLVYESAWWPDQLQGIQLLWDTDYEGWTRYISGFDMLDRVLLGWVGGKGAVTMESLTDDKVAEDCTKVLRRFLSNSDIPLPHKLIRSRWHSNRFVRGGYSHITTTCDREHCGPDTLAQPIYRSSRGNKIPAVLLAGEAVHGAYFSTTHGAFLSGTAQAQILIDYKHKC